MALSTAPAPRVGEPPELRRLHFGAFVGLFCVGVYATSFGPALPFLAADFGVSLDRAGLLLTVLFSGSILASGAVAIRLHHRDARVTTAIGLALTAAGLAGIAAAPSFGFAAAAVAVLGCGDGLLVAGAHNILTQTARDVAGGINRLNVYFAAGAILGPLWAGFAFEYTESRALAYLAMAALSVAVALFILGAKSGARRGIDPAAAHTGGPATATVWVMGGVLFLYVGAEFGLGSWVSSYAEEAADAGTVAAAALTSGYWGALMVGRLISGALFARGIAARSVLLGSLAGALVSSATLALGGETIAVAAIAAFATGLCFGPIWPAVLTIASEGSKGGAPATMVTIGNAGGILFPWLQGKLLVSAGPTQGIGVTAVLCAVMLAAALSRKPRAAAAE